MRIPVWKQKPRTNLGFLSQSFPYSWSAAIPQIVFVSIAYYWFKAIPPPGYAMAALGIAATVMAVRANVFTRTEQVVWILIAICLFIVETRAISNDRYQQDQQQKVALKEEHDNFARVLERNQQEFDQTLQRFELLSKLSQENIATATGGNSVCYVDFDLRQTNLKGGHLMAHLKGDYPLHDVFGTVVDLEAKDRMEHRSPPATTTEFVNFGIPIRVDSLSKGYGVYLTTYIPFVNSQKENFDISFHSLNGAWFENLRLRLVPQTGTWQTALRVGRLDLYDHHPIYLLQQVDKDYPKINGKVDW